MKALFTLNELQNYLSNEHETIEQLKSIYFWREKI
jgi:hypothetical protein